MKTKKTINMKFNDTELPKWFDGVVYKEGDIVTNPFSGQQAILTPNELAMHNFIKGCEYNGADRMLYIALSNAHLLDVLLTCYQSRVPTTFLARGKINHFLILAKSIFEIANAHSGIGVYSKFR